MTTATLPRRRTSETCRMVAACCLVLVNGWGADGLNAGSVIGIGQAHAQSVYRCGSSYSSDATCEQGMATSVTLQGETAHAPTPPTGLAQHMQSEADRLEKARQREAQALAPSPNTTRHAANQAAKSGVQKEKPRNERLGEHKKKKRKNGLPASPYFTAKGKAENQKP